MEMMRIIVSRFPCLSALQFASFNLNTLDAYLETYLSYFFPPITKPTPVYKKKDKLVERRHTHKSTLQLNSGFSIDTMNI